ncbi:MAG: PAS domain S-box protein [Archaeoglobus sp.]|nr:PAS domain S-box protein [Archaeoglobus sp.]
MNAQGLLEDFKLIMDSIPLGVVLLDRDMRIIRVNKFVEQKLGKRSEEIRGKFCYEVVNNGKICNGCKVIKAIKDASTHVFEIEAFPLVTRNIAVPIKENGKVFAVLELIQNITEEIMLEEELRLKEEKYRELFENSLDAIVITDLEGNIVGVNRGFESITGFSRHEVIGENFTNFVPAKDAKKIFSCYHESFKTGKNIYTIEFEFFTRNGERRIAEGNVSLIKRNGRVIGFQGNFRDVTERKKVEEKLRESEKKYRELWENAGDCLFIIDLEGNFLEVNKAGRELLGYSKEEIRKLNIKDVVEESALSELFSEILDPLKLLKLSKLSKFNEKADISLELPCHTKRGKIWIELRAKPMIENGKVKAIQGIARNITERKKLEAALKDSEELFRTLAEKSLVGIYLIQDGVFKYVNPKLSEFFGYSVEELVGRNPLDFIYPADRDAVSKNLRKLTKGEIESVNELMRFVRRDGETRYSEVYGSRIVYRGKPAIVGTLIDITEKFELAKTRMKCSEQIEKNIENYMLLVDQIRNPLAVIAGIADLKLENANKEELKEVKKIILESVRKIEDVVSKLDRGWFESERVRDSLNEARINCKWLHDLNKQSKL